MVILRIKITILTVKFDHEFPFQLFRFFAYFSNPDASGNLTQYDIGQKDSVSLVTSIHNVRPIAVLDIYDFFSTT